MLMQFVTPFGLETRRRVRICIRPEGRLHVVEMFPVAAEEVVVRKLAGDN